MPPEYAVHGRYSMKSDVFSFGVIILEIISGNKIKGFYDSEHSLNLLGHVSTIPMMIPISIVSYKDRFKVCDRYKFHDFRHGNSGMTTCHLNC